MNVSWHEVCLGQNDAQRLGQRKNKQNNNRSIFVPKNNSVEPKIVSMPLFSLFLGIGNFLYSFMIRIVALFIAVFTLVQLAAQRPITLNTVVIDAGHGGRDPGAIGSKIKEKDVTLSVALKLGKYIVENFTDVKVVYTRNKDVFVNLDERAIIANKNKADLFISIHANWIGKPAVTGTETYVLGLHRSQDNLEVAKKENAVIVLEENYTAKYEGFDPNSVESYIIFELMQNSYLDQSIYFAKLVEDQFSIRAGRSSRGVKQAGFLVLRETAMPSVLVELGYLTNKDEEQFLGSEYGQDLLASALFRAFREYKYNHDAKSSLAIGAVPPSVNESAAAGKVSVPSTVSQPAAKTSPSASPQTNDISKAIVFRVQIATKPQPLSNNQPPLSYFDKVWSYTDNGVYKYTIGETKVYAEIKKVLVSAKQKVPDAFVVAFEGDKRITIDQALLKLGQTR